MKISIDPSILKHAVNVAKVIKPKTNDFSVRINNKKFFVFSYDDRRYSLSAFDLETCDDSFDSGEYFLSVDKLSLFDTDLNSVNLIIDDNQIIIKTFDGSQSRNSLLKRRSSTSKRLSIPKIEIKPSYLIDRNKFENLLKVMSCSAQIKESKTDDDLRINQIHFYSKEKCVTSNARYYGTICYFDEINFDLSIPGVDLPFVRSFLNKCKGKSVGFDFDQNGIKFNDTESNSILFINLVQSKRPIVNLINNSKFESFFKSDKNLFLKNLNWSLSSIDGTQRIKLEYCDKNVKIFDSQNLELCCFPVVDGTNDKFLVHLPAKFLLSICNHIDNKIEFHYNNNENPNIIGINDVSTNEMHYMHYLTTMKPR